MTDCLLQTENLTKSFGDLVAVDSVDLELHTDELTSIIGPNGAGKTTFYNLLTGEYEPDEGSVVFDGEEITGSAPHSVAKKGMIRSYQIRNYFPEMTVFANLQAALTIRSGNALTMHRTMDSYDDLNEEIADRLDEAGLAEFADQKSATLNHGDQKRLEVLMSAAMEPGLAILDEPTAGMGQEDTEEMIEYIETIADDTDVLLTEHDMNVVRTISDRIVVFHNGEVIAEGPPGEIAENDLVRKVYLGEE
jgi:branched-chain amino acid transport system ATP-binding protein